MRKKQIHTGELTALADLIQETLFLCQRRFVDPETGRGPSHMLSVHRYADGTYNGYYLPILYQWGWNEYDHIVYGNGIFSMPFSHEDVWRFLTGRDDRPAPLELLLAENKEWKAICGGIRAGQVFFVRDDAEYRELDLVRHIKGGSMHRGSAFVASQMRRAWEAEPFSHTESACAFCDGDMNNPRKRGDFIVFDNRFKPHPWHKVVVPSRALLKRFPPDPNLNLLNPRMLQGMLALLPELWAERQEPNRRALCGMHFGALAGQTIAHPHLHVRQ